MTTTIYVLSPSEVTRLMEALSDADANGRLVRIAIDCDTVKVKIGEGMWTPPLGQKEVRA